MTHHSMKTGVSIKLETQTPGTAKVLLKKNGVEIDISNSCYKITATAEAGNLLRCELNLFLEEFEVIPGVIEAKMKINGKEEKVSKIELSRGATLLDFDGLVDVGKK